jgi:hypothetical protein
VLSQITTHHRNWQSLPLSWKEPDSKIAIFYCLLTCVKVFQHLFHHIDKTPVGLSLTVLVSIWLPKTARYNRAGFHRKKIFEGLEASFLPVKFRWVLFIEAIEMVDM